VTPPPDRNFVLRAAALASFLFLVFLTLGLVSPGAHNDDDLGRYLNTRSAFGSWDQILSLWNRPAFVLVYMVPARLGYVGVEAMTALISALTCFFVAFAAHRAGMRRPLFAALLTAAQPFFIALSYSALTEPLAACFIAAALAALASGRLRTTAVLASLATLARLETAVLLPLWAWAMLRVGGRSVPPAAPAAPAVANTFQNVSRTARLPIALLPLALVAWHLAGWAHTHDPLFLWRQVFAEEARTYHAVPLTHYLRGLIFVIGAAGFGFVLVGAVAIVRDAFSKGTARAADRPPIAELFLAGAALMLAVLTWLASGTSAGQSAGFLRHLVAVAPFFSLVALRGLDEWMAPRVSNLTLATLAVATLLCGVFLSVRLEGGFELGARPEYGKLAVLLLLLAIALGRRFMIRAGTAAPRWTSRTALAAAAAAILVGAVVPSPITQLVPEQALMRAAAEWVQAEGLADRPLLCNHIWFNWTLDRTVVAPARSAVAEAGRRAPVTLLTRANLEQAPAGAIAVWEGHYSHRLVGDVSVDDVTKLAGYRVLRRFGEGDSKFYCVILERLDRAQTTGRIEGGRFTHEGFGVKWTLPPAPWRWEPGGDGLQLVRGVHPSGANAQLNVVRLAGLWDPQAFHQLLGPRLSATPGVRLIGSSRVDDWSIHQGRADQEDLWVATRISDPRCEALQLVIYGPPPVPLSDVPWTPPDLPNLLRAVEWRASPRGASGGSSSGSSGG